MTTDAALEESVIVGFKGGEGSIEHFPARHDDDVVAGGNLVTSEEFPRQALGAIAFHGVAELPGGSHAESGRLAAVAEQEHRHETAGNARPFVVDALELGPAPDPFRLRQASPGHSSATVSRLRPLARRRLRTIRPFLVDIRTRNP